MLYWISVMKMNVMILMEESVCIKLYSSNSLKVYIFPAKELSIVSWKKWDLITINESFDITLVLGPMYHMYTNEDKRKVLEEAIRVTKRKGYILVAYCMN